MKKQVHIIGGGTFSHVRNHLALAAPAFGKTARELLDICYRSFPYMEINLHLTKMADPNSDLVTNDDIAQLIDKLIVCNTTKVIFFNVAICDYNGTVDNIDGGKYHPRLKTSDGNRNMLLTPAQKVISKIRKHRKDIFLIGFKTTCNVNEAEQFRQGLNLLKTASCNLVLANDVVTRQNIIVTPEEGTYIEPLRSLALEKLVDMAYHRTHLSFTRSSVVNGEPIRWQDTQIYDSLRTVVNHCIKRGAYKEFNGATTGHFAAKLAPNKFLTSIRKTNFNDIDKNGMVLVETDGPDNVIAYGAKPSVGGQSQRIIFSKLNNTDCIVHFHCPLKEGHLHNIPVVSQYEYECGSHECGQNTANGLKEFNNLYCVMLDNHGPNIVFSHTINPQEVIDFIEANFDLEKSTSGFERIYNLPIASN